MEHRDEETASARRVFDETRELRREIGELIATAERILGETEAVLRSELARRPYLTLGVAAGAGYVLGGGVPSRVARWAAGVGMRVLLMSLVQEIVSQTNGGSR